MSLTYQQQQFLNQFLQTRARLKDRLGGRQLSKIKGEYEKFCKERQKLGTLLIELKRLPRGKDLATVHEKSLAEVAQRVDTASTIGDETVFKPAYKDLEQIRKACQKDLDGRKKEIKSIAEHVDKFKKELAKALGESNQGKKTQKLQTLKAEIITWLNNHHGSDTAEVWSVCDKVIQALGGPAKADLLMAARELESRTWTLGKDIADAEETGIDRITYNTAYGYDGQVHRLLADLDKYIRVAENAGDGFSLKQLQRTEAEATRLLWIVDPPPLPTIPLPPVPQQVGAQVGAQVDDVPKEEEPQSEAEKGKKALQKAKGLVERFENEYTRVKQNYEDVTGQIGELKNKTNTSRAQLDVDLEMLDSAAADAKRSLESAEAQLTVAKDKQQEAEDAIEGDWKPHILAVGAAVDTGLRELGACEKATGQVEGGLLYIERSFDSMQSLKRRVEAVDENFLDKVLGKVPLLPLSNNTCAKDEELILLRQFVFISALDDQKITATLAKATDRNGLDKVIKEFIEGPKLNTKGMADILTGCHNICVDADRFFGSQSTFRNSLQEPATSKFVKIQNVAKQDLAKYSVSVLPRPKKSGGQAPLNSVGVAVVGGGPIGLMAAVEARVAGSANVHVYEGRTDPYSRLNVLKIGHPQLQRFRTAGVFDDIFPNGVPDNEDGKASVKTIEEALEKRCNSLGIQLERGKFLKNVTRDRNGVVQLYFKGEEDQPKSCDVLIVATGASVASAQKHADNVVVSDNLGVPFQKSTIKDYAAVGVFSKNAPSRQGNVEKTDGWAYDFETNEVKYIVTQLTEEEFNTYCNDPRALRERIVDDAQKVKLLDRQNGNAPPQRVSNASRDETIEENGLEAAINQAWDNMLQELGGTQFYGRDIETDQQKIRKAKKRALASLKETLKNKKDQNQEQKVSPAQVENVVLTFLNMELGISRFPMEFQQAQVFATPDLAGVLVGDSAATPHPSTAKGLNTGVDEIGSIRDLVEDLETGGGTEEERKQAMQMYEWEVKRRTDVMVNEAMEALQSGARTRCANLARKIWQMTKHKGSDYNALTAKVRDHVQAMSVAKDSNEAKNDRDWKLREAAVKNIRDFEKQMVDAVEDIEALIQTNGNADLNTLLAPFNSLFN